MKSIIKPTNYKAKDWEAAIGMLSNLGRELEAIELAEELIGRGIESSYLNFLLGRSYFYEKERKSSIKYLKRALEMDGDNVEAAALLGRVAKE